MIWAPDGPLPGYSFSPIGFARSPYVQRAAAPRQARCDTATSAAAGRIELLSGQGFEDALEGLAQWELAWVLFVFHKNVEQGRGWRPKVTPPRSATKRGVFATRSPHRPNPIGLSAVKIERVDGLVVHVSGLDLLDGTPVIDIKPYVPYADAHVAVRSGWLGAPDALARWVVDFADAAVEQLAWLEEHGVNLRPAIEAALSLGPAPHAYRRIRRHGSGHTLALKDWRVDFRVEADAALTCTAGRIRVTEIRTGYRESQLADPTLALHRAYSGIFALRRGSSAD